jgi:hypothetical protein
MIFYFKITKHIQFLLRKFQKNKFCASFQFYFLCIFLVRVDLVSKHEQLLILAGIEASTLECVSMGCLNWRESRAEGRAEQKSSDLIPVQARDWLSRKRNPVRPPVSPVPAKPIFKEGMLEGRLDPHVQFQSPIETRSY